MKTTLTTLAAGVMLMSAAGAFAASTVDLTVKGLIVPSACTPNLSGGGVIDHGKISAKDLQTDKPTLIGTHVMTLAMICDSAISVALHSIDNRSGSSPSPTRYGLGLINTDQKLGWFTLMLRNAVADNVQVQPIASQDGGNTWYGETVWDSGQFVSMASMSDDTQPVPMKELAVELVVSTSIAATDSLDLSNEVNLDGSATLEVKYL